MTSFSQFLNSLNSETKDRQFEVFVKLFSSHGLIKCSSSVMSHWAENAYIA